MSETTSFDNHLNSFRNEMKKLKITHYFHEISDPHMTEFTHPFFHRVEWLCGFSGFSAIVVITQKNACLWTDSIYFLQAQKEIAEGWGVFNLDDPHSPSPFQFIKKHKKIQLGLNPEITNYTSLSDLFDIQLTIIPVDIFNVIHPLPFSLSTIELFDGCSVGVHEKIGLIRKKYRNCTIILSDLGDVNWTFNIRAHDIPYSPIAYGYGIITPTNVYLFVGDQKESSKLQKNQSFVEFNITVFPYNSFFNKVKQLITTSTAVYNQSNINMKLQDIIDSIPKLKKKESLEYVHYLRSIRGEKERGVLKRVHIRDSIILCYFFSKLEQLNGTSVTEWDASVLLETLRKEMGKSYDQPSFLSIIATGKNGAMMHYEPTQTKNELIQWDKLLLCDVGGQYKEGCTTDVTRTWHFGTPTQKEKLCYTKVLQAHIDAQMTVLRNGDSVDILESAARKPIIEENREWDFKHDIGHGIGHYSFVHEYPPMYGCGMRVSDGMTTSIEPGIYLEDEFGIRIENAVIFETNEIGLELKALTLVPYCVNLIDFDILKEEEKGWLRGYNNKIRESILTQIDDILVQKWVEKNLDME